MAITRNGSLIEVNRRKRKKQSSLNFRDNPFALTQSSSRPLPLMRRARIVGTKKRTDGRTAFLKGHFVPLSRVFSLATRAMSSLGAAGGRGRSKRQGRRGRSIEAEGSSEVY